MSKKTIMIILVIIIIAISLVLSIYIPNKNKIEKSIENPSITYSILEENEKVGVIDEDKNIIIEPQYDEIIIVNSHKAVFICANNEGTKIVNDENKEILTKYKNIEPIKLENVITENEYEKNVLAYEENDKYGLIDLDGNIVVKNKYEQIASFGYKEGEILVKENNKYGLINENGKQIIKTIYDNIELDKFYNSGIGYKKSGYIVCNKTNDGYRYGYHDYNGEKVLEVEYNDLMRITDMKDNDNIYLIVAKNGQYGVFVNNAKIINTQYQSINYNNSMEMFIVERTGKFGTINSKGVEILKTEYSRIEINGIYMYAQKDEEQKVFDKEGKEIDIPFTTTIESTNSPEYYIKIEEAQNYSILNSNFEEILQEKYQYLEYAFDKYFVATNTEGKSGVIDIDGNVVIDFNYDIVQTINDKNMLQVKNFDSDITEIYNNKLEKVLELSNINTQNSEDGVKIFNEVEEYYFDDNGELIEK